MYRGQKEREREREISKSRFSARAAKPLRRFSVFRETKKSEGKKEIEGRRKSRRIEGDPLWSSLGLLRADRGGLTTVTVSRSK